MTLIVGVNTGTRIHLLSDTRITHPDVTQVEEIPGRLKLITLSPSICVGYAGQAAVAVDHVRSTSTAVVRSFEDVVEHLRKEPRCDFLAADSKSLRLATIREGTVQTGNVAYVGDDDAWRAFEMARREAVPAVSDDPEMTLISELMSAFTRVLNNPLHPTVAGFKLRVGSRADGFHYLQEAATSLVNLTGPLNQATAPEYDNAAAGAYSYTVLSAHEPGHAVVAVHMYQGGFGFVYAPLRHDKPIKVRGIDHAALREYVKEHYGVDVDGLRIGPARFETSPNPE